MKEFSLDLSKALKNGLRPDVRVGVNAPYLTEAFNFMVTERGVETPKIPTQTCIPYGETLKWPFPQIAITTVGLLMFTATALYRTTTPYSTTSGWTKILTSNLTDRQFNISDFGNWIIASSPMDDVDGDNRGSEIVREYAAGWGWQKYATVIEGLPVGTPAYYTQNCHCNFRHRLIHSRWRSLQIDWEPLGALISSLGTTPAYEDVRGNRRGYTPLEDALPTHDSVKSTVIDIAVRECGTALTSATPPAFTEYDRTLRLLPLEPFGGFIAYTSLGVSAFKFHTTPVPVFGRIDISKGTGCAGWFMAQSNDNNTRHVWVDTYGDVWTIDGSLKVDNLGYREFMTILMEATTHTNPFFPEIIIVYSKNNDAFFFTNGLRCFMLTKKGMTEVGFCPTSIVPWSSLRTLGVFVDYPAPGFEAGILSAIEDSEARATSEMLDLGIRGIKTVTALETSNNTTHVDFAVSYRYKNGGTFTDSRWKRFNREGMGIATVSSPDFRIKLKAANHPTEAEIVTGYLEHQKVISIGGYHALAVDTEGMGWAWGVNGDSQLGNTKTTDSLLPLHIATIGAADDGQVSLINSVSAGGFHSLALLNSKRVYSWGLNTYGELGDNTTTTRTSPILVKDAPGTGYLENIVQIAAGEYHSLALDSSGYVWAWGRNSATYAGAVGDGSSTQRNLPVKVVHPSGVGYLSNIIYIAAGFAFSVAVDKDGYVYCWGQGDSGQLGQGVAGDSLLPVKVLGVGGVDYLGNIKRVACGVDTSVAHVSCLAMSWNGYVYGWGKNRYGELGDGTATIRTTPVQTKGEGGIGYLSNVVDIAVGSSGFTVALLNDGTVWTWGSNSEGQLGSGATGGTRYYPGKVVGVSSGYLGSIAQVATAGYATVTIASDRSMYAWGGNWSYQVGDGTSTTRNRPVNISGIFVPYSAVAITLGYEDFNIDSLTVKFKVSDKRMIRGSYGSTNAKGSTGEGS